MLQLEDIEKEKEILKDKVENVEKHNFELKEDLKEAQKLRTLSEELDQMQKLSKIFECEICSLAFETGGDRNREC